VVQRFQVLDNRCHGRDYPILRNFAPEPLNVFDNELDQTVVVQVRCPRAAIPLVHPTRDLY